MMPAGARKDGRQEGRNRWLTLALLAAGVVALLLTTTFAITSSTNRSASQAPTLQNDDKFRAFLVSRDAVRREPQPSPSATVLTWWRALQFEDYREAKRFYAPGVDVDTVRLSTMIRDLGPLMRRTRPVDTETDIVRGRRATVRVILQVAKLQQGPGAVPASTEGVAYEEPTTFYLEERGGRWKLSNNLFLARRHAALQRSASSQPDDR